MLSKLCRFLDKHHWLRFEWPFRGAIDRNLREERRSVRMRNARHLGKIAKHGRYLLLATLVSVMACAGDSECVTVDAPLATFAMYRESSGSWKPLVLEAGRGEICGLPEYVVMVVCDVPDSSNLSVLQHSRTRGDGDYLSVGPCSEVLGELVHVTGTMRQAGSVTVGYASQQSSASPWTFDIRLPVGTYDLVAMDQSVAVPRVTLRREVRVAADTELAPIDVDVEGVDLVDVSLTVDTLSDEEVTTAVRLQTAGSDAVLFAENGRLARILPNSALTDTDSQYIDVSATTPLTLRHRLVDSRDDQRTIELPPRLDDIFFGQDDDPIGASWTSLPPDFDKAILSARSEGRLVFVTASRSWIDATGATSLSLDTSVPGLDPRWVMRNGEALGNSFRLATPFSESLRSRPNGM